MMDNLGFFFGLVYLLSLYGINNGIIKGLGLQYIASIYSVFCLYLVSLPLSFILGFHPDWVIKQPKIAESLLGLPGLYLGFSLGVMLLNLLYIYKLCRIDWKDNSQKLLMELNAVTNMPKLHRSVSLHKEPIVVTTPARNSEDFTPLLTRMSLPADVKPVIQSLKIPDDMKSMYSNTSLFQSLNSHTIMLSEHSASELSKEQRRMLKAELERRDAEYDKLI